MTKIMGYVSKYYNYMNTIKGMCMTNKGYEEVNNLIRNVVGFVDWLVDVEPVEAYDNDKI